MPCDIVMKMLTFSTLSCGILISGFLFGEISSNFDTQNYDFNLYKEFSKEKKKRAQIRQILILFFPYPNCQIFIIIFSRSSRT